MDVRYAVRYALDDLLRMSVFWHRDVHAYIATAQQSGTHWLSNLLAAAICTHYGVPRLQHIADKVIIGHPAEPATYPQIPRLVRTHHAPSLLVHAAPLRAAFSYPRYVVLVRDIRASMVSRYEKRKQEFDISFSDYLRDHRVLGRDHKWDLYKRIVFFNAWGHVAELMPERTCIVQYELLRQDTAGELERVWRFLNLPVSDPAMFQQAAQQCSKEQMSQREPPERTRNLVRRDERDPVEWFNAADRAYFTDCCRRLLKHSFGYNWSDWTTAKALPARSNICAKVA